MIRCASIRLALHLFAAGLAAPALAATGEYAEAIPAKTNVYLGEVAWLDVLVASPDRPRAEDVVKTRDVLLRLLSSDALPDRPGVRHFRYAFRALRPGKLVLPALEFETARNILRTDPLALFARKPEASRSMTLTQSVSPRTVYQGEPATFELRWDTSVPLSRLKAVDLSVPLFDDRRFRLLDPYVPDAETKKNATGLPVHGTRVPANRHSYETNGVLHQTLSFRKILVPLRPGRVAIPPVSLLCAQDVRPGNRRAAFQYPAYFDNVFFDRNLSDSRYERVYAEAGPLEIVVRPLPEKGRPDLFSGMVGDYALRVEAEPTDVRVGDPVTLTLVVEAKRFPETIDLPPLRFRPNLAGRFEIPDERALPTLSATAKTYVQTIRPLSTAVSNVPPIELAFFSPASNDYVIVRSQPIPLRVAPAPEPEILSGESKFRLRDAPGGIRQNAEGPELARVERPRPLGPLAAPAALLLLFLPPLLVGGRAFLDRFRRHERHLRRTAKVLRARTAFRRNLRTVARQAKRRPERASIELDAALRTYLGDRLRLAPEALAFVDARDRLRELGLDEKALLSLRSLFFRCEAQRFAPDVEPPEDLDALLREADRVVREIEGRLKR